MKINSYFSKPTIFLCIFLVVAQIANAFYLAHGLEHSLAFDLLYWLGLLWLGGWWLRDDSKQYNFTWAYDLGFFLYLAGVFIIPYYLLKTRGIRGLLNLFAIIGIFVGTYIIGVLIYVFLD